MATPATSDRSAELLAINTMRGLAMDAVQAANSGHPGTPIAMSPVVSTLYQRIMRYDPTDPNWPNRDRFVLSAGHASMLLYSILHLTGVKMVDKEGKVTDKPAVSLDEIKRFRQLDSLCPGHPEYGMTTGVETTTGPLGQGLGNSVGIAIAQKWSAAHFNQPGFELFNFNIYALCGDGCMMEGISSEAASLAAHLKLDNLCWIYDSNRITIEGSTDLAFNEDVGAKYKGIGFNVLHVSDANDTDEFEKAIKTFQATKGQPTLIIVQSHIAWGVPGKQDTHAAHGEPLGVEAIKAGKKNFGLDPEKTFAVDPSVYEYYKQGIGKKGPEFSGAWRKLFDEYKTKFPELADNIERMRQRQLPAGWDKNLPVYPPDAKGKATRESSGEVLNAFAKNIPWLIGGAADLAPSTKTRLTFPGAGDFQAESYGGRNFHFGIREHAMGAILNGMSVSKIRAYGSGFLIFSDYGKTPIRLAALMEIPVIYIFTHDSIGVGEDGPTHQPIEQLISLRAIPMFLTIRPADANEVLEAWKVVLQLKHEPAALILSRQALPTLDRTKYGSAAGLAKGAYVLADSGGTPDVILMATGSEVYLCVDAYEKLKAEGIKARVVSMPCWELFEHQSAEYKESVLPSNVMARVAVEQASIMGWHRYIGMKGAFVGMRTFGASAPLKDLQKRFGIDVDHVLKAAKEQLAKK